VKDAKSEAQKEIEEYRDQKEEEFKKYEQEVSLKCAKDPDIWARAPDYRPLRQRSHGGSYWDVVDTDRSKPAATRRPKRTQTRQPRSSWRRSSR